ncbi:MAG: pyridoxal phosphate-dependent aminotransferase [Sarcina sp.]
MELSKKRSEIASSLTLALTAKAAKLKAEGEDVISFGAGEPDFNTPKNIIDAAIEAMNSGKTKYTAVSGIVDLKEAIIEKLKIDNNLNYSKEDIIVSTGAKQCLANVFQAILNEGDAVIVPSPYWISYPELIKLADGVPVFVETLRENNFKITKSEIEKAINENKKIKAIIINSPNNPTGAVYNEKELLEISEIAKKFDLFIISDEIYEKLIYSKENKHISIASLSEDAFKRTIVINGFSKAYSMTGWRVGYAAGPKDVIKIMTNVQSHTTSNVNTIAQYACVEALRGNQEELEKMIERFKLRKEKMTTLIKEIKDVNYIEPMGAFYAFIDISKILQKVNMKDSLEFSNRLLDEKKVVVVPGVAFGADSYIRLSYATSEENIEKGLKAIKDFVNNLI